LLVVHTVSYIEDVTITNKFARKFYNTLFIETSCSDEIAFVLWSDVRQIIVILSSNIRQI